MADLLISGEFLEGITRDQLLSLIRDPKADPTLLEHIVSQPVVDEELWRLVLNHPATTPAAMAKIARAATLPILKELTGDRALLSRSPQIPHAILDNPAATEDEITVVETVLHEQARDPERVAAMLPDDVAVGLTGRGDGQRGQSSS